jgi:23S rRNA pseudouridine2605 synthase
MTTKPPARASKPPRHGVARVISKLSVGSRTQAAQWVREGRVRVNGQVVRDAEFPVWQGLDRIDVDGQEPASATWPAYDDQGRAGSRYRL